MESSLKQKEVLNTSIDTDVLVNAGAGSGKTTVLTNKVVRHLTDSNPKNRLEPSELLVLTFTNNAAHEMKTRIIEAVSNIKGKNEEETKRFESIKLAINSAHIQTFDSFIQEIVKEFAYKLHIPNTIFIANEFVLKAYQIEMLDKIFEKKYESQDMNFINFISKYNSRDDKKTKQVILSVYEKLANYTINDRKLLIQKFLGFNNKEQFIRWANEYKSLLYKNENERIAKLKKPSAIENAEANKDAKINADVGDIAKEYERYASTFVDIEMIFSICNELEKELNKYKLETHTYTYDDIANMGLALLQDDEVANTIRNRFKYVMVDEYQDTNRLQKSVIDILTQDKNNGCERSRLFAVGDPKQSIYGFRNADLNIFRQTQEKFKQTGKVICMDENYRSFGNIINDVNTICNEYMTFSHGGIDYKEKGQSLLLPKANNFKYNNDYGIHVITTANEKDLLDSNASEIKLWEVKAIIQDILEKMKPESNFKVWDAKENNGEGGYRHCKLKDFYILARTKSNYAIYEKEFLKAGIQLNNTIATNLVEVNAIMLINSLVKALAIIEAKDNSIIANEQMKHIFASIARSYIYKDSYSDQQIINEIKDGSYLKDAIFTTLESFYKANKNNSFSKMLMNLINEFNITLRLPMIGEVEKNASKIESLYQLILAIEQSGGRIKDFSQLLEIISKHSIDLQYDSVTDLDDAVTLMTIHQSKGLQNKIVYLPNSVNHLGGAGSLDKPDYDFSEEFGILLPIYNFEDYRNDEKNEDEYPNGSEIYSLPYKLFRLKKGEESKDIDEHVRLFYVALTRAEEAIYIVGYPHCKEEEDGYKISDKNKETLFHMLGFINGKDQFPFKLLPKFPKDKWHKVYIKEAFKVKVKNINLDNIDDTLISCPVIRKAKASQLTIIDNDIAQQNAIIGNELHHIMESIDFNNPNLDFINNTHFKDIVSNILELDLFKQELKEAKFYQEYSYIDSALNSIGYIDLLAIKDGIYYIIDWKLSNTDKEAYEKQMHIYQRNIQRIFNIDKTKIKLYLISLEKQTIKEVVAE